MKFLGIVFLLLCSLISPLQASDGYATGQKMGSNLTPQGPRDPGIVPGFQGASVPEANLREDEIVSKAEEKRNEAARIVQENKTRDLKDKVVTPESVLMTSYLEKSDYRIDENDPILKGADEIAKDPLKSLNASVDSVKEEVISKNWRETCVEPGHEIEGNETTFLTHVSLIEKKRESNGVELEMKVSNYCTVDFEWLRPGYFFIWLENPLHPVTMENMDLFSIQITKEFPSYLYPEFNYGSSFKKRFASEKELEIYFKKTEGAYIQTTPGYFKRFMSFSYLRKVVSTPTRPSLGETSQDPAWMPTTKEDFDKGPQDMGIDSDLWSQASAFEDFVDQGMCHYTSSSCVEGPETRFIKDVPVFRKCWAKRQRYTCQFNSPDTCASLRKKGCQQIGSKCIKKVGGHCAAYEQTLECREQVKTGRKTRIKGSVPFCLDGSCHKVSWEPNKDMAEALSKLAILKQLAQDLNGQTRTVFTGEALGCGSHCVNFTSCCGVSGAGWGVSLGLSSCSENEKKLAKARGEKKCVLTGTYCAEKVLGVCIRKKTNFCCFNSKLARVFHEQARSQLGMGFGNAENPQCQGLTFDQIAGLNFDNINLSEIFDDLLTKVVVPDPNTLMGKFKSDWKSRMPSSA